MTIDAQRFMPSVDQPLGLRLRRDLIWTSADDPRSGESTWIAEDPLSRRLFRCGDREYQILQWLDQENTISRLISRFQGEFAPAKISEHSVRLLLNRCTSAGLFRICFANPTGEPGRLFTGLDSPADLVPMPDQKPPRTFSFLAWTRALARNLQYLTNAQWSLGSPDRALEWIGSVFGWLYARRAVQFWLTYACLAFALILLKWDQFLKELPSIQMLRSPGLLIGYGIVFVVTRAAHELGHAVVCKRLGARCRDVGLMMSYGMLCPYVDITDAWRLGNRFQRMWVALAGMYTELVIACVATGVWFLTHPGWLHDLAFQILLVCSLTTLLFNANPLMKYDGYFVLCDWLNVQNLRERAFRSFDSVLERSRVRESLAMTVFLSFYLLASTINRIVVSLGIMGLVYFFASQWQLSGVGIGLIAISLLCNLILKINSWASQSSNRHDMSARAQWLGWCAVGCLLAWAIHIPIPNRIHSVGSTCVGEQTPIYVLRSGIVVNSLEAIGPTTVSEETVILQQGDYGLDRSVMELEAKLFAIDQRIQTLSRMEYFQSEPVDMIPTLRAQRLVIEKQLVEKRLDQSKLLIRAGTEGVFLPIDATLPQTPNEWMDPEKDRLNYVAGSLSTWTSPCSKGRNVDSGTLIGFIRKGNELGVECTISEEQRYGIEKGFEARVYLAQFPGRVWKGHVVDLAFAKQNYDTNPALATARSAESIPSKSVHVRIVLDEPTDEELYPNGTAEVVILRPNRSMLREATDFWLRNVKLR